MTNKIFHLKVKLKKFTEASQRLLPHEISYLLTRCKITDSDRRSILLRIEHNARNIDNQLIYDTSIDKRKYSKVLHWIAAELSKKDVDKRLLWISNVHTKILLDEVDPNTEAEIIRIVRSTTSSSYYFMKFYEMLVEYRHYLLIRMRYQAHAKIDSYIVKNKYDYQKSKLIYDQMHQATADIITSNIETHKEAIQWKQWLKEVFDDKMIDGLNRYASMIRYTFICLRYNMLHDLEKILLDMDEFFSNGENYSKRLLMNYYDNMLVLYDKKGEFPKAIYYGYLSIKNEQSDSLIYRNNLVNVLIKYKRFEEGLRVMEDANFKIKSTRNFHSVVGFVANQIRCLSKVGKGTEANTKGRVFLAAYQKDIMQYRWHRFFAAYLGSLLLLSKNNDVIKLVDKYNLVAKEQERANKNAAARIITLYYTLAMYKTEKLSRKQAKEEILSVFSGRKLTQLDPELMKITQSVLGSQDSEV